MDWQDIITAIIICLCVVWMGVRILFCVRRIKDNRNTCGCCRPDCPLRHQAHDAESADEKREKEEEKKASD